MRFLIIFTLLLSVGAAHAQQPSTWTEQTATTYCSNDLRRHYGDTLAVVGFMGNQWHENNTTLIGLTARDTRAEYKGQQVAVGCIYKQDGSLFTVFFNSKIAKWVVPKKLSTTPAADTQPRAPNERYHTNVSVEKVTVAPASTPAKPKTLVKKTRSGICHAENTTYYSQTKYFTPYSSIEDCLNSGGRLPKR